MSRRQKDRPKSTLLFSITAVYWYCGDHYARGIRSAWYFVFSDVLVILPAHNLSTNHPFPDLKFHFSLLNLWELRQCRVVSDRSGASVQTSVLYLGGLEILPPLPRLTDHSDLKIHPLFPQWTERSIKNPPNSWSLQCWLSAVLYSFDYWMASGIGSAQCFAFCVFWESCRHTFSPPGLGLNSSKEVLILG